MVGPTPRGIPRSRRGLRPSSLCDSEQISFEVDVPPNATAWVDLPGQDPVEMMEGGMALDRALGVRILGPADDRLRVEIGSGSYHFLVPQDQTHFRTDDEAPSS